MTDTDTDTTEYRLQDDVTRVVRSGLVLKGDETVELTADEAAAHDDVLERIEQSGDDQDQEASDE